MYCSSHSAIWFVILSTTCHAYGDFCSVIMCAAFDIYLLRFLVNFGCLPKVEKTEALTFNTKVRLYCRGWERKPSMSVGMQVMIKLEAPVCLLPVTQWKQPTNWSKKYTRCCIVGPKLNRILTKVVSPQSCCLLLFAAWLVSSWRSISCFPRKLWSLSSYIIVSKAFLWSEWLLIINVVFYVFI